MVDEWSGGVVTAKNGDDPPTVTEWHPVSVPGRETAFSDVDGPIAYRTTFEDPRLSPDERTFLELAGAYGDVRVWINGEPRGRSETYFTPSRFEFEPRLENEVIVRCEPPGTPGIYGTAEVPDDLTTPGIWWDVGVTVEPATFVRDLELTPRMTDDGAEIDATVEVDTGAPVDDAVTLSVRPEGFRGGASMDRIALEADAGERVTASKTVTIRDPELWWPREFGSQPRYTVRAKLEDTTVERTVGIRSVEYGDDGLVVNGNRVPARGFVRSPGGDYGADVEAALEANATMLRVRGHVPAPAFYDACDEAGLLVWQELPIESSRLEAEVGRELAETLVRTYGHRPSLVVYGVGDTPVDPFADPVGSGFQAKLAFRWRAWRGTPEDDTARAVAEAFPETAPSFPVVGPPGVDADAVVLSPGWQYLEADDIEWLLGRYPGLGEVVAAFGTASLTEEVDPATVPGVDAACFEARVGGAEESRVYQATTLKTVAEALRRHGADVCLAATLRDTAPGGGTGVLARDGEEKPAYGALADAFEPVQAVLESPPEPGPVGVSLLNDTADPLEATVDWRAGGNGGEFGVSLEAFGVTSAATIEVPGDAETVTLEVSADGTTASNEYYL